ncbi:hypothetical protein GCM10025868_19820 [Angustibacter aerolatus]|uniref:Uncharacterized protein n=1 Tax=Angustibacter aerolatus TaxID=1162965 RepID=A0ABQ6JIQ1_9ACTN|nr:hypothetical protein GCM10025868_19820 [Angustibacter aerolatus]
MSGHRKSFHTFSRVSTARVASGAPISGSSTCTSVRSRPAPSMRAASSSSRGRVRKNCRSRNTPNGVARFGSAMEARVSTRCRCFITSSVGIMITWNGTMSVASISTNATPLPANRTRANA